MSTINPSNTGYSGTVAQLRRPTQAFATTGQGTAVSSALSASQSTAGASPFAAMMADQQSSAQKASAMPAQASQNTNMTLNNAHLMQKANADKQQLLTIEQLGQNVGKSDSLLDVARNDSTVRNLRTVMGGFNLRAPTAPMADSIKSKALAMQHTRNDIGMAKPKDDPALKQVPQASTGDTSGIGKLSQQFESGSQGISAIGYDRVGGTSYGKYQIASRVGSMDNFLNFLDKNAPDMAEKLRAAGPSNTGSRSGAMPDVWKQIAADEPGRFEALQEKFIYDSHYKPAVAALSQRSELDGNTFSPAMQEVLFSTAVQHGPTGAARIFSQAAAKSGEMSAESFNERLIDNIYDIRSEQFGASTPAIQQSARNRMQREKDLAQAMLQKDTSTMA